MQSNAATKPDTPLHERLGYVRFHDLAVMLGIEDATLDNRVAMGGSHAPPLYKLGNKAKYFRLTDVERWMARRQKHKSSRGAGFDEMVGA